jgi:protoheme IX farnesyltransferase
MYSVLLFAVSLALGIVGVAGFVYLTAASVLGAAFVYYAYRLWRSGSARASAALFKYSIVYLALLFAAIAVDGLAG